MAAYSALASLMNITHDIQHHPSPPVFLHSQQLRSLTQILTSLLDFLETFKSPVSDGDESDPMEMEIADAAYAVEDVIESHIVNKIHSRTGTTASHRQQTIRSPTEPKNEDVEQLESTTFYQDLQRVIEKMDLIKQKAMKMDSEKDVLEHNDDVSASAATSLRSSSSTSSAMVCSEAVLRGILDKLINDDRLRQVIIIHGMGGIGKTTLAANIYSDPRIKQHFDVCAWSTISQKFNTRDILCEVVSQVTDRDKKEVSSSELDVLKLELHQELFGRRFLIVMDDIWSIDACEDMQLYFPDNGYGSRILVTTRQSNLGSQLNTTTTCSHQMEFLDEVRSWDLFSKTVFGERSSCPHELEEIGKKTVADCRGLPLSIVVVGGILKREEQTKRCWESVRNNINSLVNLESEKHCLRLLKLSYNHLPAYLKPCFLYVGVFEEDAEIRVSRLINLWVSEGFLKPMNDVMSLETIAMGYLKNLVDRNLIQIHKLGSTGNIKSCKIHDLLRDLCLREGQRDGFLHVIGRYPEIGRNRQCRRVVIPRNTSEEEVVKELEYMGHACSVICEHGEVPTCPSFELLRTFHAFSRPSNENSVAFGCVNLRHLAAQVECMPSFFSSLSLFWNLHTLIIASREWNDCTAPAEIWKMPQFRHIEFTWSPLCLPDPPQDDDDVFIMRNLRTLKGVMDFKCCEEVVKRIPNIKKLKIKYYGRLKGTKAGGSYFVDNIEFLCKLESFSVVCDFHSDGMLNKLSFPQSLKKLDLNMYDGFELEAMLEKIGSLPCLEKLKLWYACFRRGKWEIVEGQFPQLKYLEMSCRGLKQWTVEQSCVFPCLEQLYLYGFDELEEFPDEIGNIATLQNIRLDYCSESVVNSAKEMVEEQVGLQGDQLPFHVDVLVYMYQKEVLKSFEDHNFTVSIFRF